MKKIILSFLLTCAFADFSQAQCEEPNPSAKISKPKPCEQEKSSRDKKTKRENRRKGIYEIEKELNFDFDGKKNEVKFPKGIKTGEFYRVKVENINLNNYRVELQIKDTVYYSKALDFPVFGSIDISGLEGILGTFKTLDVASDNIEAIIDSIGNNIYSLGMKGNDLSDPSVENIDEVKNLLNAQEKILFKLGNDLKDPANQAEALVYEFKKRKILAKAERAQSFAPIDLKKAMTTFESLRSQFKSIESKQNLGKKAYDDFFSDAKVISLIKKIKDEPVGIEIAKERENIEKAYAELSKIRTKAQALVSLENEEKSFLSVYQLYTSTTYTSLPIQFTGEEAEIKMSFIPKDSASNLQTYHLSPIKFGRSPWYWSVGPGMYYSRLQNDRVGFETIQVNDSTQNFRILEENPIGGEIGVSALFHGGRKFSLGELDLGIHLSVGTGISLGDEIQARMLYGGGLALGKKNHLTIDFGEARGFVNSLAKQVETNGFDFVYSEKPSALVKEMDNKFFISIGYMFTF